MKYKNANEAFIKLYQKVKNDGVTCQNTKTLYNIGFYIENPYENKIDAEFRKWNMSYAEYEWQWYLSGDPNAKEISKKAPIWKNHMDDNGQVRSNYGWQWNRNNQLEKVIAKLSAQNDSRQAVLSFYDGKEIDSYTYDTPCTNSIHFQIVENTLCITVNMRSNDLWFGFCNDQYCFSKLQSLVAEKLKIKLGWYYHFASNLHLYNNFLNK
jgi:thymidylate synthase